MNYLFVQSNKPLPKGTKILEKLIKLSSGWEQCLIKFPDGNVKLEWIIRADSSKEKLDASLTAIKSFSKFNKRLKRVK